ncbi:MAG: CDP-glycerol glycerophosphotransferase family protein [Marmoricola sp.]
MTVAEAQVRHLGEALSSVHAQDAVRPEVLVAPWGTWREPLPPGALAPSESLAHARRAGLEAAGASYVRFLEATDTVPAPSTRRLLAALRERGAVSAVGVSERIDATWRDRAHAPAPEAALDLDARLFGVTEDVRGLVLDPVHGRWADPALARLDRDHPPVAVPDVVHHDHHREHGLPFGHLPRRASEVHELDAVVSAVNREISPVLAAAWAGAVLDRRLPTLVEDVESFDVDTWAALRRLTRDLWERADLRAVRVEARLQAWLVAQDRRDALTALVLRRWRGADDFPTRVRDDGTLLAALDVDAPDDVLTVQSRESPLWASLRRSSTEGEAWTADLVVVARGLPSTLEDELWATFDSGDGVTARVLATPSYDDTADRVAAERHTDHAHAAWSVVVGPGQLPDGTHEIELELRSAGVVRRGRVTHRDELGSAGHLDETSAGSTIRPVWTAEQLQLEVGAPVPRPVPRTQPRLTEVALDDDVLTLRLEGALGDRVELRGPGGTVSGDVYAGSGIASVRLVVDPWELGERPLPLGTYDVRLLGPDGAVTVGLSDDLLRASPLERRGRLHRLTVRPSRRRTALVVLDDLRGPDEVGPGAQHRLQREYAASTAAVDPGLAYFQSYTGQRPTDSPLVIHESLRRLRPDVRVVWGVDDPGTPVPEGAEPVLLRSRAWYSTLASARWIVTNIEMERWFRRRLGQELLQTWHGNPGKVMGLGLWRANGLTPGRIEQNLDHGPRSWTLLMSPSPEMTEHYRREFAYDGPVVEQGYARDDPLLAPDAAEVRAESRRRLGIGPDQTAVLYAPTWRDTMATDYRAARLHDDLDLAALAAALGPDHVVLLRGHRFHARHPERPRGARLVDVTEHPEINHLLLAADVAVLDYSSLRFDIGVVGLPMVFLVPDLVDYERSRGFLFDFRSSAPGPLLATTDEVVAALRDLDGVRAEHASAYAAFRARFLAGQDGHAADRAVEVFFGSA